MFFFFFFTATMARNVIYAYEARAKAHCNVYYKAFRPIPIIISLVFLHTSIGGGGRGRVRSVYDALLLLYYPDISITIDDARLL